MDELEKVIKSFEECLKTPRCQDCPWESCERADCARAEMPYDLVYAALELLKAQEPVMHSSRRGTNGFSLVWTCGKCGSDLEPNNRKARYCSNCGQAVKWE